MGRASFGCFREIKHSELAVQFPRGSIISPGGLFCGEEVSQRVPPSPTTNVCPPRFVIKPDDAAIPTGVQRVGGVNRVLPSLTNPEVAPPIVQAVSVSVVNLLVWGSSRKIAVKEDRRALAANDGTSRGITRVGRGAKRPTVRRNNRRILAVDDRVHAVAEHDQERRRVVRVVEERPGRGGAGARTVLLVSASRSKHLKFAAALDTNSKVSSGLGASLFLTLPATAMNPERATLRESVVKSLPGKHSATLATEDSRFRSRCGGALAGAIAPTLLMAGPFEECLSAVFTGTLNWHGDLQSLCRAPGRTHSDAGVSHTPNSTKIVVTTRDFLSLYRREHPDRQRVQQMTRAEIEAEIAAAVRAGFYALPEVAA